MKRFITTVVPIILFLFLVSCGGESEPDERQRIELGEPAPATAQSPAEWGVAITDYQPYQDEELEVYLNDELVLSVFPENDSFRWPYRLENGDASTVVQFHDDSFRDGLRQAIENRDTHSPSEPLTVTDVRFRPYESGTLRGFADVELNGVLTLRGLRLLESDEYWIGYPALEDQFGRYHDVLSTRGELRETILQRLVEEYE